MIYLLQVFLLVSVPIFALAGVAVLLMFAWSHATEYARAHLHHIHIPHRPFLHKT